MKKTWIITAISSLIAVISLYLLINFAFFSNDDPIESWEQEKMNYTEIHKITKGKNQKIALIDSGIVKNEFKKDIQSINYVKDESEFDVNGHGTMMLSLIKGTEKSPGICPNCSVLSIKVMNKEESIKPKILADAIDKSIQAKATVINFSLGSYFENKLVKKSIQRAIDQGIVVVASSGDYGTPELMFPANMKNVISVGAINRNGKIWNDSNAKNKVDINAPGVDVTAMDLTGENFVSTGTSQATALISGYVALMKEHNPNITFDEIKKQLQSINQKKVDYEDFFIQDDESY